ncbi:HAMP domain-containing histidine kinase [Leeia oryzae]|uniref:HAMP domain-containing histidine kinase n=1 Tax=Leeia oryzae TaxID=356662 RepID=UPI000379A9D7|nr:HAMP domain-containing histidine kinase [Leeia oryzae]
MSLPELPYRHKSKPARLSLRRQLLVWLLLPQLVLWVAAAGVSYHVALRYANIAIDHSLWQSSKALARQVKPLGGGLFIDFPRAAQQILEEDPDDMVFYMASTPPGKFILGNRNLPPVPADQPIVRNQPFFYDGQLAGHIPVRVAALYVDYGAPEKPQLLLVQVAKGVSAREQLAREILYATALPLSLLMVATSVLVWWGISRGLTPLRRLRRLVENRNARDLAPIELESAPAEVRSLAEALNALLVAVNHSIASQRRFIGDAAHQLRTPLAGLKSQTELAMEETDVNKLRERLRLVQTSATRSIHLVNQLLTLARAEPDQERALLRAPVDLTRLVRETTAEAVPRALQAGIDLGCEADVPPMLTAGNSALLREMLMNLIDNAIHYTGKGGAITVRLIRDGEFAAIQVEDDGPGIPEEDKVRVFERFYRVAQTGSGCGLGLAIVQEIAHRHHASVTLQDAVPHGLLVTVSLPLEGD